MSKKQSKNVGVNVAIGAGVAVLSAAAYLLFGHEGKKNRKMIRGWSIKMKGEIIEKLEAVKEITEPVYHDIVDKVTEKYTKIKNVDKEELLGVVADTRKQWKNMMKDAKQKKKMAKKSPAKNK